MVSTTIRPDVCSCQQDFSERRIETHVALHRAVVSPALVSEDAGVCPVVNSSKILELPAASHGVLFHFLARWMEISGRNRELGDGPRADEAFDAEQLSRVAKAVSVPVDKFCRHNEAAALYVVLVAFNDVEARLPP